MRRIVVGLVLACTVLGTMPVVAQEGNVYLVIPRRWIEGSGGDRPAPSARREILPSHVIVRRLRGRGFTGFRGIDLQGERYSVRAYTPAGNFVRMEIDAYTGEVIEGSVLRAR